MQSNQIDQKNLKQKFYKYIIPSLIAQWVFALYTMIDGMFVARGVSEVALSGVNIAMPFVTFLFSLALMFAVGSSTHIAIALGKKDNNRANEIFTQTLLSILVISCVITFFVIMNCNSIALFLGATENNISYVTDYLKNISFFSIFFIVSYAFEVIIKTDGFPVRATIFSTGGAILNCILDYLFVIHWDFGVTGAAVATGISQLFVSLCHIVHFLGPQTNLKLVRFKFQLSVLLNTMSNGISSAVTEMSPGIVIFMFNHYILRYLSEDAIVSYSIVSYVNSILILSMLGIAQGMQPIVSYEHGNGNQKNCRLLLKYGIQFSTIYSVAFFFITRILAQPLVNIFVRPELSILRIDSVMVFHIFSICFLFSGFNIVISGYFTSTNQTVKALSISLLRGVVFIAILLPIITKLFDGNGIWYVSTISEILCMVLSIALLVSSNIRKKAFN